MLKILVTNDDGIDSPLLSPLLRSLKEAPWCKELRCVVPSEEQSWVAQGVTRFRPVFVRERTLDGAPVFLASGTPADCASLGIYNLFPDRPDLLVSGINMGTNAGLAFFLSSGTIGGANEGFLAGVPAIAVSANLIPEAFSSWSSYDWQRLESLEVEWRRLASAAVTVLGRIVEQGALGWAHIYSLNLPWDVDNTTPIELTSLEDTRLLPLFKERGQNCYIHQFQGLLRPDRATAEESDIEALGRGKISLTPIRYALVPPERERFTALLSGDGFSRR